MFAAAPKTVTHAVSPLKAPRFCGFLSMRFINSAQSRKPRHFALIGTAFFIQLFHFGGKIGLFILIQQLLNVLRAVTFDLMKFTDAQAAHCCVSIMSNSKENRRLEKDLCSVFELLSLFILVYLLNNRCILLYRLKHVTLTGGKDLI